MTLKECYEKMGADYESVAGRLRKEERILKFLRKVPEDSSYGLLCGALQKKDMEEAFRAAHTLKGICQNLSLTRLGDSVSRLTELLRNAGEYSAEMEAAFAQVQREYECAMAYIRAL